MGPAGAAGAAGPTGAAGAVGPAGNSGTGWTASGTSLYNSNTGGVGIGTTTPAGKLNVSALGQTALLVNGRDTLGISLPVHILVDTTTQVFDTNTFGRLLRFQDQRAGAGIYDLGIDGNSSFFITTKNAVTGAKAFVVTAAGKIGINGILTPNAALGVSGNIAASGTIMGGVGAPDLAENIAGAAEVEAADVVIVDPRGGERVVRSQSPYQTSVLGVISTKPGLLTNAQASDVDSSRKPDATQRPIALAGRVPVKVTLDGGPIKPGDLLASSGVPGHAMRAAEPWRGGIVGVALTGFTGKDDAGHSVASGKVLVFLQVQSAPTADLRQVSELHDRLVQLEGKLSRGPGAAARLAKLSSLETRLSHLESHLGTTFSGGN